MSCFVVGKWSSPPVTGMRPPPCDSFTLTMVDGHTAVLFGGFGVGAVLYSHLYVLDLEKVVR